MADAATGKFDLFRATEGLRPDELVPCADAVRAGLPPDCLLADFGIVPVLIGRGACVAEMTVGRGQLNQRGIAQAGALVAFADACAGWAAYTALPAGRFTTLELRCSLLRAAREGARLRAQARPVHLGRRTLVFEVDVTSVDDPARPRTVARFGCTQLVLDEPDGQVKQS